MAIKLDVKVFRGTDVEIEVTVLDIDGEPLDLTGIDLHHRVAREAGDAAAFVEVNRPQITHVSNVATIPITNAQTKAVPFGLHYHELYEIADGKRRVLMWGAYRSLSAQAAKHEVEE